MLTGFDPKLIEFWWPLVYDLIEHGLGQTNDCDFTVSSIHNQLKSCEMQCWGWWRLDRLRAVLLTKIINYPKHSVCTQILCAGDDLDNWKDQTLIDEWAKSHGCAEIEIYGRRAWGRALKQQGEWREVSTHFRRKL